MLLRNLFNLHGLGMVTVTQLIQLPVQELPTLMGETTQLLSLPPEQTAFIEHFHQAPLLLSDNYLSILSGFGGGQVQALFF